MSKAMVLKVVSYSPFAHPNTINSSPTKITKKIMQKLHTTCCEETNIDYEPDSL